MCSQGGAGKPARFFLILSCQMCRIFGREISYCYCFLFEEVSCIPVNILCEVYVVKVWEGMVQKSLCCHTISEALEFVSFSCCTVASILYA